MKVSFLSNFFFINTYIHKYIYIVSNRYTQRLNTIRGSNEYRASKIAENKINVVTLSKIHFFFFFFATVLNFDL